MTCRWISRATGIHPETVRRYMEGQPPSVEIVSSVCSQQHINPQWPLTGERECVVRAVERRMHAEFGSGASEAPGRSDEGSGAG